MVFAQSSPKDQHISMKIGSYMIICGHVGLWVWWVDQVPGRRQPHGAALESVPLCPFSAVLCSPGSVPGLVLGLMLGAPLASRL